MRPAGTGPEGVGGGEMEMKDMVGWLAGWLVDTRGLLFSEWLAEGMTRLSYYRACGSRNARVA